MSANFSTAVYVEAPPPVVCAAIADLDSWKQWMPDFVAVEKLTPGPMGPGTEWRETRKMFGKEATEQFRVTRWDPPRRIDIHIDGAKGSSKHGDYLFTYEFMPERTGTNVELAAEVRMGGIWALLSRFVVGSMKKACHKDLEALKAHLESPWPADTRH